MNELSLFTGAGGGVLGTMLCGHIPIGYVEWNERRQQDIANGISSGIYPEAPIFTDVREFIQSGAARQYRGFADLVTAGFPCQPFSVAGGQLAASDERDMWPATAETIRIVQPEAVFLENVPGLISTRYIRFVVGQLAEMGYVGKWGTLGASDIGADHHRKRVWFLAYSERYKRQQSCLRQVGRMGWVKQPVPWDRPWQSALRELRRMDDGLAYRADRTDSTRNGQIPAVVKAAWVHLQ